MLKNSPRRQRGGMLSMLLTLVVIGLLAYFALRSFTASKPAAGPGSEGELASCSKLAGDLVQRTGGLGPDYRKGYEALPEQCRGFLPPPAAQEGRPDPDQGQGPQGSN